MYRLLVNGTEMRQSVNLDALESILDHLPRILWTIQTYIPGLGWRDLEF